MRLSDQFENELMRIRIFIVAVFIGLLVLGGVLCHIQVLNASIYRSSLKRQSMRAIRLPGLRGTIYDRNGTCLAGNRPSFCVVIYTEELRESGKLKKTVDAVDNTINRLAAILNLKRTVTREEIIAHLSKRWPMPLVAWKDVDKRVIAKWAESDIVMQGVDINVEPVREYPQGALAAHVIGYLGRFDPKQDDEEAYHFYIPEMEGQYGVEKAFNQELAGIAGGRIINVDASGFYRGDIKRGDRQGCDPISGDDITLTIDSRVQRIMEDAMAGERGGAVVLDPRNGEVLAMASTPSFDPNSFGSGISSAEWKQLNTDENHVLVNRVIAGGYPPGSTFKPIVAIAALESGRATESTGFNCSGYFRLGAVTFHCWKESGHGWIPMQKGIEQSCNAYFCQLGLLAGHMNIIQTAREAGLGRKTGIEMGGDEESGLVPDPEWKKKRLRDEWRKGDTCNLSIGQGALVVTPLQMAMVTSVIANGGYLYRPRLLFERDKRPELSKRMPWSSGNLRIVRAGMYDVIQAPSGTGKRAMVQGVEMAGKTGTAEFGPKAERKKYTWMTIFAPFDKPRYAVAMVIEEGMSGGITVAPRMKKLMEGIFVLDGTLKSELIDTNGSGNG